MVNQFDTLDDRLKPIVKEIIDKMEEKGWQPYVASGRRSPAQQAEKVASGVSTTNKSYHLRGLAADIVDKRYGWNLPLHHDYWYDLGCIVEDLQEKYDIVWGGVWQKDLDKRWAKIEKARSLKKDWPIDWFFDCAHVELHL